MPENYPPKTHQPPHIYLDNTIYFFSIHTFDDQPIFTDARKKELLNFISRLLKQCNYKLYAYSMVPNHYHLLVKVAIAKQLSNFFQMLHGSLSFKWNKEDNTRGRRIFQSYWDYCIRDDKDFWTHFNYIHQNPIKHGLVKNLEELKKYPFCSYQQWLKIKGEEWLCECFADYPVVDYIVPND